jgi:hypothetical protein
MKFEFVSWLGSGDVAKDLQVFGERLSLSRNQVCQCKG